MKKYFIILSITCLPGLTAMAQQQEHTADSVLSTRTLHELNLLFNLSPGQQDSLYEAGMAVSLTRRQTYSRYFRTDSFKIKMAQVALLKDSLYLSVLGSSYLKTYKDTLIRRGKTW